MLTLYHSASDTEIEAFFALANECGMDGEAVYLDKATFTRIWQYVCRKMAEEGPRSSKKFATLSASSVLCHGITVRKSSTGL
jgi:hypothetical protein